MKRNLLIIALLIQLTTLWAQPWNLPHKPMPNRAVYYSSIIAIPKTFDPAKSYEVTESAIISQIYEPPYQYHYLKRPYKLVTLTASQLPKVTFYNSAGKVVKADSKDIAKSVYDIEIEPGIYYQPHPAFAKTAEGKPLYLKLNKKQLATIHKISDFKVTATKELTADDYIYEIKRLASPQTASPIFGVMSKHIDGFSEFSKTLTNYADQHPDEHFLDLNRFPLAGVKKINRYHYQIILKDKYLQFKYWLAMNFFAPMPQIVDAFYSQDGLKQKNISLASYPVGTGPYMMLKNNPNKEIVLVANPNFHQEFYPIEGEAGDKENGFLDSIGKKLPMIYKLAFKLEKESIPRWNKFLQGYYDKSGIGNSSFDQAIRLNKNGEMELTEKLKKKGIQLQKNIGASLFYLGFNMLDPIVGGYSEQKCKLRQAISIALNYEEYIDIFLNGRGVAAQSPIPPGVFGYQKNDKGYNHYIYNWSNNKLIRKSLDYAKKLLAEAGYPGGKDPKTGKALMLHYDVTSNGSPDDKSVFSWYRKQIARLGIELDVRSTLYNRFQDKIRTGKVQLFSFGWLADYPDPENFLFLLYGPNGKVAYGGENATNYQNPQADKLFEAIRDMPDGQERQNKINQWLEIVRKDSPMAWGFHPIDFVLSHQWVTPGKISQMIHNNSKYMRINHNQRWKLIHQWNRPAVWVIIVFFISLIIGLITLAIIYWQRQNKPATAKTKDS